MLPKASNDWSVSDAAHLVRRAGFGGSPEEIRAIHQLGREAAVESLLKPDEAIDAVPIPNWASREEMMKAGRERFMARREMNQEGGSMTPEEREKARRKSQQEFQRENRRNTVEGQGWWFERMLTTRAPLREKMVLFWHDHFATSVQKVKRPGLMIMQNELFREHALGSFKGLTHSVLRDPAMLLYLDTQNSKKGKPNENFAREVMELFTLGEGNYTEGDVKEAARAFTGYALNRRDGRVDHQEFQWDSSEKVVFGKRGAFDGDQVIDLLFEQEAASRYLPGKLWQYFVEDEVPPAVLKKLAKGFRDGGFEVEPLLREIFLSRAFYDSTVVRNQIKSPIQYLLQMLRELEIDGLPPAYLRVATEQLGQTLFLPPNVAGWDWGKAWINTNTLLSRYNIAGFVTAGSKAPAGSEEKESSAMMMAGGAGNRRAGMMQRQMEMVTRSWKGPDYERIAPRELRKDPEVLVDLLIDRLFQAPLRTKDRQVFVEFARSIQGAVLTNHEVAELCHLMMSTPQYQLA